MKQQKTTKGSGAVSNNNTTSNILYIGHLPRNFAEHELLVFLKQFGLVQHVRVSRSKKTGGSRGYAFVQLVDPAVAAIVADTLSGYLLGGKRLVCHIVPPEKIHKKMLYNTRPNRKEKKQERSLEKIHAISKRLLHRQEQKKQKLAAMGIDYQFEGYVAPSVETKKETKSPKNKATAASTSSDKQTSKKRKDSLASVESAASSSSKSKSKKEAIQKKDTTATTSATKTNKKRKDSIASVESTHSEGSISKRKRKESVESNASEGSQSKKNRKESVGVDATPTRSVTRSRTASKPAEPQSEKKPKESVSKAGTDKRRRKSS